MPRERVACERVTGPAFRSLYIPHHRPEQQHPSSVSSLRTVPCCLYAHQAAPKTTGICNSSLLTVAKVGRSTFPKDPFPSTDRKLKSLALTAFCCGSFNSASHCSDHCCKTDFSIQLSNEESKTLYKCSFSFLSSFCYHCAVANSI